jgi:uncharacterized protein (DUF58 family)
MTPAPGTSSPRRLTELLDSKFMARLDALDIVSRKILQGKLQGERRSKRRGQGVEFADHRPYVVGDDLRFVDWNIFGRLDQFFLKLFLQDEDLTVHVLLDVSASSAAGDPPKERAIKRLAAALAYVGLVNNNRVTISAFADGLVGQLANMRGRNYLRPMAEFLLAGEADGPSHFEKACRQVTGGRIGTGVVVVLSDFLFKEGFESGLRRLISRRYDLYAIQMLSPQELSPEITGDLKLIDVEDADEAEVTISAALIEYYKRNLAAYCNELRAFCRRRGATHVLTDSSQPIEPLMLNYLRRRGLLR